MLIWLFLLFTIVPVIEIALLIKLGGWLGVLPTVAMVVGTGALGAWLARQQGLKALRAVQSEMASGRMPADALLEGILVLLGAVLLITPGVLTDLMGLALLIPPIRRVVCVLLRAWAMKRVRMVTISPGGIGVGFGDPGGPGGPRAGSPAGTFTPHTVLEGEVVRRTEPPMDAEHRERPPGSSS